MIFDPYSVPTEVKDKLKVLADVDGTFSPGNYEVFYLNVRPREKQTNKQTKSNDKPLADNKIS